MARSLNLGIYFYLLVTLTVISMVYGDITRRHPQDIKVSSKIEKRQTSIWYTIPLARLGSQYRSRNGHDENGDNDNEQEEDSEEQRISHRIPRARVASGNAAVFYVRLVGGITDNEGRVEIRRNSGSWGMVCDDGWSLENGVVVCKMLGYRGVMSVHHRANVRFGTGRSDVIMDDVACNGSEQSLAECRYQWEVHNCDRTTEAAGVTCLIDIIDEDHPECYTLENGADYRGTVSQTRSGLRCQAWNEQRPHSHNFHPISFPGFGLGDHNYCRSMGRAPFPWCFTTSEDTEYGYCSVGQKQTLCRNPSSPECYTSINGSDYRGFASSTIGGKDCINWIDGIFEHDYKPGNYPNQGLGDHNYCRNVNGKRSPWCIVNDPDSEKYWDYCEVAPPMPSCDREIPLDIGSEANVLDSFWIVQGAAIEGHNRRVINKVTPRSCAIYCLIEDNFTCRSFDYSPRLNRCWLSGQSSHQVSLTITEITENYTYYERINIGATGQFTMIVNKALDESTEKISNISLHSCASACLVASFGCASIDYARKGRDCWLNSDEESSRNLRDFDNDPYDHFDRKGAPQADCYSGIGLDYRGFVSNTENGTLCANWLVAAKEGVVVTSTEYPNRGLEDHNNCRNADDDIKPWCYYGNAKQVVAHWAYCDIPLCSESVTTPSLTQAASTPTPPTITLLSQGKEARQSSTLNKRGFRAEASFAVDGNLDPHYRQRSCSSTVREQNGWWYVDLGDVHNVEYVEVVNEFDNVLRIRRTEVTVGMVHTDLSTFSTCGTIKKSHAQQSERDPSRIIRVTCPQKLQGRYVRLQMKRRDLLTLCEVRVWGTEGTLPCESRQFMCHSHDECISDTFLCDREDDCNDGSDEESCVYPEKLFSEFENRALPNVTPLMMYMSKMMEDCAKICLYDLNLTCRSFEYSTVQQSCKFFNQTRADTGGLAIMTGYNYYELKSQINCPTVDENFHPCPSGKCIDSSKLCDSINDCGDFSDERNCGSHDEYRIQLSNGTAPNEGRVEVSYQGQWGLVCDDFWDLTDAGVVCRELGYIRGASEAFTVAEFGHGNRGIIFMDDVQCQGSEASLKDCKFDGWGQHNCVMGESAGVQCYLNEDCQANQFQCLNQNCIDQDRLCDGHPDCGDYSDERDCQTEIEVRLVNVNSSDEAMGRLEVYYLGRWGTVCDTDFTREDALVVCKQLGYVGHVDVLGGAHFGKGSGQVSMDNVACVGNEFSLGECDFTPGSQSSCTHQNDVGIACGTPQVNSVCGVRTFAHGAQTRIVGGSSAKHGSWPWQVQLIRKEDGAHLCGGTLIDDRHVLSAAHCFQSYEDFKIRVGEHNLRVPQASEQDFTIECKFKHEQYDTTTTNNDIILLRLNTKNGRGVVFTDYVRPICLPEIQEFDDGHKCWISGWGNTNTGELYPDILQEAKIPLLSKYTCSDKSIYGSKLTEKMICAGILAGGIDTCDGDSGGPLQCQNQETGVWKLWGITSWGFGCAKPFAPGVYTKVTEYLEWIESKRNSRHCQPNVD